MTTSGRYDTTYGTLCHLSQADKYLERILFTEADIKLGIDGAPPGGPFLAEPTNNR